MQDIEAQMHSLLDEIAPDVHDYEEQAKIIAQASSIFSKIYTNKRLARKGSPKIIEAHMTDAILQAMGSLNTWSYEEEDDFELISSKGLTNNQLLRKVANKNKPNWGRMDIINPDILDFEFEEGDEDEAGFSELKYENGHQPDSGLKTPGMPKHKTDSISAPVR
jgi:hypothetical protein